MSALHELTGQYLALANDDELPPQAISDTLESIEGDIRQKAISLASWVLDIDLDIEKIDSAMNRLAIRKKQVVARNDSLKDYLQRNMEASGITKIQCPLFTITLVAGRESVAISNESIIPDEFLNVKTVITPDKIAIAKALKEGQTVEGATMQRGNSSIRIK